MHKNSVTADHRWTINSEKEFPLQFHRRTMVISFPTIRLQHQTKGKSTRQPLEAQFPALTDGQERKPKETKANILLEQAVTPQIPCY